jgi:hypothetical protein
MGQCCHLPHGHCLSDVHDNSYGALLTRPYRGSGCRPFCRFTYGTRLSRRLLHRWEPRSPEIREPGVACVHSLIRSEEGPSREGRTGSYPTWTGDCHLRKNAWSNILGPEREWQLAGQVDITQVHDMMSWLCAVVGTVKTRERGMAKTVARIARKRCRKRTYAVATGVSAAEA